MYSTFQKIIQYNTTVYPLHSRHSFCNFVTCKKKNIQRVFKSFMKYLTIGSIFQDIRKPLLWFRIIGWVVAQKTGVSAGDYVWIFAKEKRQQSCFQIIGVYFFVVPLGIEPRTHGFSVRCSTN